MSTTTHPSNGHVASLTFHTDMPAGPSPADNLALSRTFAETVLRYLLQVLPQVRSEIALLHSRAEEIPDLALRSSAFDAIAKRGNVEGAALFAALAPRSERRRTVRALVAFQSAYSYLDALSEQPSERPIENGDQLHQALLTALAPGAEHPDYYAHCPRRDDGGYLIAILERCRDALDGLPSFPALAPTIREAGARIVDFQALNLTEADGGHLALERWARERTVRGSGLRWWETAAAAGSSLSVHALIAAAAEPDLGHDDAREIDRAYFPSIGALHSLLDSLVDRVEDHDAGRLSLLDHYASDTQMETHLKRLAETARARTERLPDRHPHRVILTAMCSYYLSAPESRKGEGERIRNALTEVLGLPLNVAILMFHAKRMIHSATDRTYS